AAGRRVPADRAFGTVPSADPATAPELLGVSARRKDIWAVGDAGGRTLAEHGTASGLHVVPTPSPLPRPGVVSQLEGVDAVGASLAFAVGTTTDRGSLFSRTLIERFDGSTWSVVPSPNPASGDLPNTLHDVVAFAAPDAGAAGSYGYSPLHSLTAHLVGSAWQVVPTRCGLDLRGVSGSSPSDVWAVGSSGACHYDGTRWTLFPVETLPNGTS